MPIIEVRLDGTSYNDVIYLIIRRLGYRRQKDRRQRRTFRHFAPSLKIVPFHVALPRISATTWTLGDIFDVQIRRVFLNVTKVKSGLSPGGTMRTAPLLMSLDGRWFTNKYCHTSAT